MNSETTLESLVSVYATGEQSLIVAEENRFRAAAVSAVCEAFQSMSPQDQILVCCLSLEMQQGFFKDHLIASLEKLGFQTLVEHVRLGRTITASQLTSAECRRGLGFRSDNRKASPKQILAAMGKAFRTLQSALKEDQRINDWVLSSLRGEVLKGASLRGEELEAASLADASELSVIVLSGDERETEPIPEFRSVPPKSTGSFPARFEPEGRGQPLGLDLDES